MGAHEDMRRTILMDPIFVSPRKGHFQRGIELIAWDQRLCVA